MTDIVTDLPGTVDFDLDTWQPDQKDLKQPFRVKVGGRVISFSDPRDLDWKILAVMETPVDFIRHTLSEDDRRHLMGLELDSRRLGALMEGFMAHFDVDEQIAAAQQQAKLRALG